MGSILSKAFASQQLQFAVTMVDGLVTNMNAQSQLCVLYFLPIAANTSALQSGKTNSRGKIGSVEENQWLTVCQSSSSLLCCSLLLRRTNHITFLCLSSFPYNEDKY